MEIASGALGAILGAVCALVVQRVESGRLGRRAVTQNLYQKWQSLEMTTARSKAFVALRNNMQETTPLTFVTLAESFHQSDQHENWLAVSRVIHFFEECGALMAVGALDKEMTKSLLGRYIEYWHDGFLLPLWQISNSVDSAIELHWYPPLSQLRAITRQ